MERNPGNRQVKIFLAQALIALIFSIPAQAQAQSAYKAGLLEWRQARAEALKAPKGWLSLAGLHWLKPGENSFGAAKGNMVVFPKGAPAQVGTFRLQNDSVWMEVLPGMPAQYLGEPVSRMLMYPGGNAVDMERFSWVVLKRGELYGVRLWDAEAPALKEFSAIDHFKADKKWHIKARFVPFPEPRTVMVPNILGMEVEQRSPGVLKFKIKGRPFELLALEETETHLFIVFSDETTGAETYGGGRYLSVSMPDKRGKTIIDFNKAYNPPCVFTPYATCLLPMAENRLNIAVTAGEKNYGEHPE